MPACLALPGYAQYLCNHGAVPHLTLEGILDLDTVYDHQSLRERKNPGLSGGY